MIITTNLNPEAFKAFYGQRLYSRYASQKWIKYGSTDYRLKLADPCVMQAGESPAAGSPRGRVVTSGAIPGENCPMPDEKQLSIDFSGEVPKLVETSRDLKAPQEATNPPNFLKARSLHN